MLTLYYAANTCALASHIALEEAGAAYDTRRVDFATAEQTKPDYLAINPKGRVPALVTERGVLTETPAILAYIAQSPSGGAARAARRSVRLRGGAGVHELSLRDGACRARASGCAATAGRTTRRRIEAMKKKVPQSVGACFDLIEREDVSRALGDGRGLHDRRPLSLHHRALAGGRRRRPRRLPAGARPPQPDGASGPRSSACFRARAWRKERPHGSLRRSSHIRSRPAGC